MSLPPALSARLIKLLGMIGSEHDGEALNAARLADRLVRENGLTWENIIDLNRPRADLFAVARACIEILQSGVWLKPTERRFLTGLPAFRHPTEKQLSWLNDLLDRAREFASRPPTPTQTTPPPPPPPSKPRKTRASGKRSQNAPPSP